MARAVYPYELTDPDFSWLLTTFKENNPQYTTVEFSCLPVVLIAEREQEPECMPDMLPEEDIGESAEKER